MTPPETIPSWLYRHEQKIHSRVKLVQGDYSKVSITINSVPNVVYWKTTHCGYTAFNIIPRVIPAR